MHVVKLCDLVKLIFDIAHAILSLHKEYIEILNTSTDLIYRFHEAANGIVSERYIVYTALSIHVLFKMSFYTNFHRVGRVLEKTQNFTRILLPGVPASTHGTVTPVE